MFDQTINGAVTIAGNSTGTMLANRYRVVRPLGSGGMGSVWLVEDVKLDNKPFAVKMLPAILVSNRRAYEQVKREALIALKLVHPHIVQFRALEEAVEGDNPFLVMDYIDGRTLDDYLAEKGKLTEDETLKVLRPIAAALDYAHAKGVVHRDVKPGNVMIAKDGTPYILDFGIAREIQETMTRVTGKLSIGTLMYMSPEQLHGDFPKAAQDVYSFAAMAYECLAGAPPFSRGQIEYQIDHDAPAPLTGKAAILAAGVMAGLAKKPEDRPPTCTAVLGGEQPPQKGTATQIETMTGRVAATAETVNRSVHNKVQLWEDGPYWADANIGAEKPEDYGFYFWWGDTVGYKREDDAWVASDGSSSDFEFNQEHTSTCGKSPSTLKSEGWIIGGEERKSLLGKLFGVREDCVLTPKHDAAQAHWGGEWRMPTKQELKDLCNKCDWTWTTMNGANGYVVRGRGNYASVSIFLPCAGYGIESSLSHAGSTGAYWASVPHSDFSDSEAWDLGFNSGRHGTSYYFRHYGQSVRPVQGFTQ